MADTIEVSQIVVEAGFTPDGTMKASQIVVEAGFTPDGTMKASQVVVELAYRVVEPPKPSGMAIPVGSGVGLV